MPPEGSAVATKFSLSAPAAASVAEAPHHEGHVGPHKLGVLKLVAVLGEHGLPLAERAPAAAGAHR